MSSAVVDLQDLVRRAAWNDAAGLIEQNWTLDAAPLPVALSAYKTQVQLGHAALSEAWLDRALALAPDNSTLQRDKGVLHQGRKEWQLAVECFKAATQARPDIATYHALLGGVLQQQGDHPAAAKAYRAALDLEAANRPWWVRLGRSLLEAGDLQAGANAFERALALQEDSGTRKALDDVLRRLSGHDLPEAPNATSALKGHVDAGEWQAAQTWLHLHWRVEDAPLQVALLAYKTYSQLTDAPLAEAWLDRALELAPGNSTLQRDKGVLHQGRLEWDRAIACYRAATANRPDVAAYHALLGHALQHQGQHADACTAYRSALLLDGSNRQWWARLARSAAAIQDSNAALDAYTQALALQDDAGIRAERDELLRQRRSVPSMGAPAALEAVKDGTSAYPKARLDTAVAPVWDRLLTIIRSTGSQSILDLRCGSGQFSAFLAERYPGLAYAGLDPSGPALAQARARCPKFLFEQRSLPVSDFGGLPAFDTVLCLDLLAQVHADRQVLSALPAGSYIIAALPGFEVFGDVRMLRTEVDLRSRYGQLIDDLTIESIAISPDEAVWLVHGHRSAALFVLRDDERPPATEPVALTDVPANVTESIFWTDGTRYVEEFLPRFGLPFYPLVETLDLREPHVALRHDVTWSLENAMAMAALEQQLGVRSTYFLLHPDGGQNRHNYFGHVEGGQLVIHPRLFDAALRLIDQGHEVGLNNDLITLAVTTRRQPQEFLEQIVEAFAQRGVALAGSVSHGSRLCAELGYFNYQIFRELKEVPAAAAHRNDLEKFARATVEFNGHSVKKFQLRMADYGLRYEANFLPWDVYVSDSSARWSVWAGIDKTVCEKFAPPKLANQALDAALAKHESPVVQCLVHACHWSPVTHVHPLTSPSIRKRRDQTFAAARQNSLLDRLRVMDNVLLARGSDRFVNYDQNYITKRQLFSIAAPVGRFLSRLLQGPLATADSVLEVGCGQGDFLASAYNGLSALNGGREIFALGVDGSPAAILTCAGRYSSLRWIADDLEHFLSKHDELVLDATHAHRRYDLILDKTGATFIQDHGVAKAFFESVSQLLKPTGLYVYVASRDFYQNGLFAKIYSKWPKDWLQMAAEILEPVGSEDDEGPSLKGYVKRTYRRRQ